MLKEYRYKPEEIGLPAWPSGELQLAGTTAVTDPREADVFVCPGPLLLSQDPAWLDRFPHMAGNEERHVFFDCSDHDTIFNRKNCILLRCNLKQFMLDAHPNSISVAWPVEQYPDIIDLPEGGFLYDVSFQGWSKPSYCREIAPQSCLDTPGLKCDIARYDDFTGYLKTDDPEFIRRRSEFKRSMKESRVSLCPESIPGVFPYRFFEAMTAGRVPVLVSSDFVYPWASEIPYRDFILHIERNDASHSGEIIADFLKRTPDEELVRMGRLARMYWQGFLNAADWSRTMGMAVEKKLKEIGCVSRS